MARLHVHVRVCERDFSSAYSPRRCVRVWTRRCGRPPPQAVSTPPRFAARRAAQYSSRAPRTAAPQPWPRLASPQRALPLPRGDPRPPACSPLSGINPRLPDPLPARKPQPPPPPPPSYDACAWCVAGRCGETVEAGRTGGCRAQEEGSVRGAGARRQKGRDAGRERAPAGHREVSEEMRAETARGITSRTPLPY